MTPKLVSSQKIARQPTTASTPLPITGASIGAAPMISIRREKIRAESSTEYRSRTTARTTTMPAEPPIASSRRAPNSRCTVGANAHSALLSV